MADRLIGSGLSGLSAAQLALATTSHNIANVNTPGYSRQSTVQGTQVPQYTGSGFIGRGTTVDTVRRSYSNFLEIQARSGTAATAQLDAHLGQLRRIDNLLGDPASSLSPAIDDLFAGVNAVASYPADTAARQSLISSANALTARFNLLAGQLDEARIDVNRRIEGAVAAANGLATQIADLNQRIVAARGVGSQAQEPNDLLDERDRLVRELNGYVKATVVPQDDGSYNVFIGTGQALVLGPNASRLVSYPDPANVADLQVGLQTGGTTLRLRPTDLGGGELAGLVAFRAESLDSAANALGRIAIGLATAFNDQHRLGQDRNGALGQAFFFVPSPQVLPNAANSGTAAVSADVADYTALTTSDYRVTYDGANYTVTRLADNQAQSFATLPQTLDGVTFSVTGTPGAGDSFIVQPTRAGARDIAVLVSDTNLVAAAAPIRTAASLANRGNGVISAGVVNGPLPTDPNLTQPVTITFTGPGTFDVSGAGTGNPVGLAYTPGATITFNGWSVTLTGAPAAGDTFTIGPNASGVGDNRNALALARLQTTNLLEGATTSLQGAYAQLVSGVGNETRTLQVTSDAQTKLLADTKAAREAVSGVNLDEEAANLLRYQQAYQASAKVLSIAATLFDAILDIRR